MKIKAYRHCLIGLMAFFLASFAWADTSPTSQLKSSIDQIITLLKDKEMDKTIRRDKMRAIINDRFYFKAMSQSALSRNWRSASKQQQEKFISLFSQLLEKTYLGRIEAYTDEKVEYLREKNRNAKRAEVYTHIITKTTEIPINYKLAKKGEDWLVYDVVIEEVSLISNFRSSYGEIIKKEGMDSLLSQMEQKVQEGDQAPAS